MTTINIPLTYATPINFQSTLDGIVYSCTVYWLYYGQRSYISIQDQYGNLIVNIALIGSSTTENVNPVNILAGYFKTSTMYYYPANQVLVISP